MEVERTKWMPSSSMTQQACEGLRTDLAQIPTPLQHFSSYQISPYRVQKMSLLKSQSRIWFLVNMFVQHLGELLSLKKDLATRNLCVPSPEQQQGPLSITHSFWRLVPCLTGFLWTKRRRQASEVRECVCVLVSLLVGLGILSKLVCSGLTDCSLVCLLVFWLVLFKLSLSSHGWLQLLLDNKDLTLQFWQFLN